MVLGRSSWLGFSDQWRCARCQGAVEHPFGTIRQWMNQEAFLVRGLEKLRAEFSLTALAFKSPESVFP
ncbi:MAG: hypothetical protein WB677_18610 [Xanthobacteraceae bacterium]